MIETVRGPISETELGVVSAHEHLFIDMRGCVTKTGNEPDYFYEDIRMDNRGLVISDPYAILDNALMESTEDAVNEMLWFKEAGGNTIVDCTLDEIGRDVLALKEVSERTGVNIIAGCGNYYDIAHPQFVENETEDQLAQRMLCDIEVGIAGSGIKAGVIGEIGTSAVITDNEKKVLRGAGIAAAKTKLPVHVHTDLYTENGFEVLDILTGLGVSESKICIDHVDVLLRPDYMRALMDRGAYIEFDNFGKEFYVNADRRFAYDLERIDVLFELIKSGYGSQILISNDICLKTMLRTYGGPGYAHILCTVRKMAKERGIEKEYEQILTQNVKNFFK
ncbi:MAG: hypothetical protein IJ408_03425 [Clostridia bacterium]|nr:hypothetical protein [Clostridia bacterium]